MDARSTGRAGAAGPIVSILVILTAAAACARITGCPRAGIESTRLPGAGQYLACAAAITLYAWHQRKVLVFLCALAVRHWIIGGELLLLAALALGTPAGRRGPALFWDYSPWAAGLAGYSAATFVVLAWSAVYLVENLWGSLGAVSCLRWSRLEPVVIQSGLPRLLCLTTRCPSPRHQFGWFLMIAGLPVLFILALPGLLPAVRPACRHDTVEWTWLAGLALGAMTPYILLPICALALDRHRPSWHRRPLRGEVPPAWVFAALLCSLAVVGLLYALALLLDRFQPAWLPPPVLLCLLLAVIAVGVAVLEAP